MLQITVQNGTPTHVRSKPRNAEGGPALLDGRDGRALKLTVLEGDGTFQYNEADPYGVFCSPANVTLQFGDPPRLTRFEARGDRDLSAAVDDLVDIIEMTHVPPVAPPPATDLGLTEEPA